ncbi:MAG: SBBP repeat-containing protein, partial [Acidobacteriota bacterium]
MPFDGNLSRRLSIVPLLLVLISFFLVLQSREQGSQKSERPERQGPYSLLESVRRPLAFERNDGQFPSGVKFGFREQGVTLYMGPEGLDVNTGPSVDQANEEAGGDSIRIRFLGANPGPELVGEGELSGIVNSLRGSSREQWVLNIPLFEKVRYRELYPGIDLLIYGRDGELEYDLEVAPGVDPSIIEMRVEGAEGLLLGEQNNLIFGEGSGLHMKAPVSYASSGGGVRPVGSRFVLMDGERVGFQTEAVAEDAELVIDPVLVFSSVFGGSSSETLSGVAVDASGFIYVAGSTRSSDLPTVNPIMGWSGNRFRDDILVSKFSPDGATLIYSTYIGGNEADGARAIAVDGTGRVAIAGSTSSDDFPLANPVQTQRAGKEDGFVLKLNAAGNGLLFSSYLGGSELDRPKGVASDAGGNVFAVGLTKSTDFPTVNAY